MRKSIFISLLSLLFFSATAQDKNSWFRDEDSTVIKAPREDVVVPAEETMDTTITAPNDTLYIDTTLYYYKLQVPKDSVEAWKNLQAFAYVKYLDSLLKAKKEEPKKQEDNQQDYSSGPSWLDGVLASSGLQLFLWTLAIVFVLFVLYKLFLTEGAFRRKTTAANTATPEVAEEVITGESNFAQLIKQALQNGNYRLAVRYQYLQTLNKLAAKNLITLAADKTNYQYVRELSNKNHQNEFAALTLNYEYVWYGEFNIEENIYRNIETGFTQLNNKL
jgi:hypothetical protein